MGHSGFSFSTLRSTMRAALQTTFSSRRNIIFGLSCAFIFGVLMYIPYFSGGFMQIIGNMGPEYGAFEFSLLVVVALLFGINITLLIDRISQSQRASKASVGTISVASILGILFSGCTACGLTLASYVGLGSFATLLPWGGNEIKLLSILLLLYSIWRLAQPASCTLEPAQSAIANRQ